MTARKNSPVPETSDSVVEVFDLNAAVAQRREASKANNFDFKYGDKVYHMPMDLKASVIRKLKTVDHSDIEQTFEILLGDQSEAFFEEDPEMSTLVALMGAYEKAVGASLGKESGSES
jgi:hypothetical protein